MEIPTAKSAKPCTAMQRCNSRRAAVTIWPLGRLAKAQDACYMCFGRYEDKSIPRHAPTPPQRLRVGSEQAFRSHENTGPVRPDFSKPNYAQIEYIRDFKGDR